MSDEVREIVAETLPTGRCSLQQVAVQLGVDRRTIHRRLAREGETFSRIVNAVRTEMVTRFIENRDRPLYMVAESLGFSALSAFSRWFRTRFGRSASDWRAAHVARPARRGDWTRDLARRPGAGAQPITAPGYQDQTDARRAGGSREDLDIHDSLVAQPTRRRGSAVRRLALTPPMLPRARPRRSADPHGWTTRISPQRSELGPKPESAGSEHPGLAQAIEKLGEPSRDRDRGPLIESGFRTRVRG